MKETMLNDFSTYFGEGRDVEVFFAPGRVNLIGEHTDYNGGHVFPCALTIGTYAAVRKRTDNKLRFLSMNFNNKAIIESDLNDLKPSEEAGWTNYPKGVMWAFAERGMKMDCGLDMLIYGNIPNGSGLSSSASLEVLTGLVIKSLYGFDKVTMVDLALIGQYSENHFNGCNCGIMDQFASAMGKKDHAIFLDTSDLTYEYAPVKLEGAKIVITNSKVKHSLVDSAYNERRQQCEKALSDLQAEMDIDGLGDLSEEEFEHYQNSIADPVCRRRAKHAVYENQRTIKAVKALEKGDITLFGELMNQSHNSLRDDYEVSCDEVDFLVDEARKIEGVIGTRITGGGFGGCTVSIVKDGAIDEFQKVIGEKYLAEVGHDAEFYVVEIGDGAHAL
ncbi:MAG: galactokinase [Hespellia sp.]|nr:galactokinase [Hespellia sp.]